MSGPRGAGQVKSGRVNRQGAEGALDPSGGQRVLGALSSGVARACSGGRCARVRCGVRCGWSPSQCPDPLLSLQTKRLFFIEGSVWDGWGWGFGLHPARECSGLTSGHSGGRTGVCQGSNIPGLASCQASLPFPSGLGGVFGRPEREGNAAGSFGRCSHLEQRWD